MKKLTIVFLSLLIAAVIFLSGIFFIKQNQYTKNNGRDLLLANNSLISRFNSDADVEEKNIIPRGIIKLSNEAGINPILNEPNSEMFFYSPNNGEIRFFILNNEIIHNLLDSGKAFQLKTGLFDLKWSYGQNEIVAKSAGKHVYYNLDNNNSKKLDGNIVSLVFLNSQSGVNDANVAYFSLNPNLDEGGIYIVNFRSGMKKKILNTRYNKWIMSWQTPEKIGLSNDSTLFLLNTVSGGLEKILYGKSSLDINWLRGGNQMIYSSKNQLFYFDTATLIEKKLNTVTTASQCVWNKYGSGIYCYNNKSFFFIDVTGDNPEAKIIADNPFGLAINDMIWDEAGKLLIFRETTTNKFYGVYVNQ